MAQKYPQHRKRPPLISLEDALDEGHKVAMEERAERISRVIRIARELFERLNESGLTAEGRGTALQILSILNNRFGE